MHFVKLEWLNSVRLKVLLAYVIGVVLSILLITLVTFSLVTFRSDFLPGMDVAEHAQELTRELQFDEAGIPVGFNGDEDDTWIFQSLKQEAAYRVIDESRNVVLDSAVGEVFWPPKGLAQQLESGRFTFERDGVKIHAATEFIEHGGQAWYVQFAVSTRLMNFMYQEFALPFMGVGIFLLSLVLLFVFSVCAYVTLGYTLKPLREVSESAAAISPRSLHTRLQTESVPSEISPLVDSFNSVLDRLEHGYRTQQEFLATTAHELKTPLALIRAQIELMAENDDRDSLLNDVEHMTRQVQQLLLLAEASEVQNYQLAVINVYEVAREVTTYLHRMAEAAHVRLVMTEEPRETHWLADQGALFTLLKNLLENAIQHAPKGTEVRVEVDAIRVSVRDWGPGVDQEQLPQMFTRFWRGVHRRDHGAGLGLTICREIALAHGWTLSAYRGEPGMRFLLSRSEHWTVEQAV